MMEAISEQSKIETSLDDEKHLNEESTETQQLNSGNVSQKNDESDLCVDSEMSIEDRHIVSDEIDLKDKRGNSNTPPPIDKIKETANEALDTINLKETKEIEATFQNFEENCVERKEAEIEKSQSYNLEENEKQKINNEYYDNIENEIRSMMHSPENAAENVNISSLSKSMELFKSEEVDREENATVIDEIKKDQIQANIEIEDSFDSSVNDEYHGAKEENNDPDKDFEEHSNEKEEAEGKKFLSFNLEENEKLKVKENYDYTENEITSDVHSAENAAEDVNISTVSKESQLSKSERTEQGEKATCITETKNEQIEANIEIEDSSDSSVNEVNIEDHGGKEENKNHKISPRFYHDVDDITHKENQMIEKLNTDEDKEIVSISDEESMESINEKQTAEKICSLNTNVIKENYVINLDDESHDDIRISEDSFQKGEQNKESECLAIKENNELEYISNRDAENLSEVNTEISAKLTEVIRKSPSIGILNGNEHSNENLKIDVANEEDSCQSKPENAANECDEKHKSVFDVDLKDALTDDNSLVNSIKRQFLKMDCTTELPKLNGDHKAPETDQINSAVIEIHGNSQSSESAKFSEIEFKRETFSSDDDNDNFESNLKIIDDDAQLPITSQTQASPHLNLAVLEQSPKAPVQIDHIEDECSRTSIASMASSSTATSSSHHLVIDDTVAVAAKKTKKQRRSAKITRKRKLSQNSKNSETSPQHKQPHLDLEAELVTNTAHNEDSHIPTVNCQIEDSTKIVEASMPYNYENTVAPLVLHKSSEVLLENPPSRSSPLLNSLLTKKLPESMEILTAPTHVKLNNTKYLCFNCKSGSFDSLIALNEHQRQCLVNKSLLPPPIAIAANTPPQSPENEIAPPQQKVSRDQLTNNTVEKLRYYKCSSCGTFHENWNLFLHIREKHKRHMCLYCIRMFPTAEKLSLHLEIKHDLEQNHFNTEEALRKSLEHTQTDNVSEDRFLMCCTCQHIFLQSEPFSDHICTEYMQACDLCGQKGRHTNQCKAQTEAKRSRVKKKAKEVKTDRLQAHTSDALSTTPQPGPFSNPPQILASNCDHAPIESTLPPSTLSQTKSNTSTAVLQQQNEDSNSSCNMVIDETCNNTNYSRTTPYNPFKALDERERLEQQTTFSEPVLPPDRQSDILEQAMEKPALIQPLIVPKFKLRVPKEFQKSVDAAISSTESEDDDEANEDADNSAEVLPAICTTLKVPQMNVGNESATESATEIPNSQEEADENSRHNMIIDEEDSLDEPNSNLVRILQEIERTKLDIMRTKDALQTAKSPITASMQRPATISQSSSRTGGERNWTPTPPASPNPQWSSPRRALSHNEKVEQDEPYHEFKEDFIPPRSLIPMENQERRDTTGSDIDMDIDETISGQPTVCIQRSNQIMEESKESDEIKAETTNEKMDTSNENSSINIDDFGESKESVEELSNSSASVKPDLIQEHTAEDAPKEEPVIEEPKPYIPQQSPRAGTPPTISVGTKSTETEDDRMDVEVYDKEDKLSENRLPPADGIEVADDDTIAVDLQLDRPLEKFETIEFVRICLKAVYPLCLYCNHARRIAVNGKSLVLHLIAQHRFAATVDSITAEELQPGTIVAKLKSYLPALDEHFFNSTSYCTMGDGAFTRHFNERIFECFQCRFVTSTHKELYLHNRKMHIKTAILCFMCRANFFSFSEILCHICPGEPNKTSVFDVKFRCCLCDVDNIPSPFRLMVHLRKKHFACDVCLEDCRDQGRLSSHVWKHKLHHLCYRCGIAYRNKMDITKHLFWKHGTESIICKRCLQKRWRHVYHFCVPPSNFICDICTLCFSKATYLKVHKRIHTGDLRYPCTEENCDQKFISRRLLLKHAIEHQLPELPQVTASDVEKKEEEEAEQKSEVLKPEEVKIKDEKLEATEVTEVKDEIKTDTSMLDMKATSVNATKSLDDSKAIANDVEKPRKKKKNKRNKESLEDLNLIAPNLSESDSSDDSDVESKSKSGEDALVPKVMLSPPSESEHDKESKDKSGTGKVLEIWQNFLQAQGSTVVEHRSETDYTEDYYPTPNLLHVVQSDHDYCVMFKPVPRNNRYGNISQTSPVKSRKTTAKSPRHTSVRRSDASSSSSGSSSSSDSSCSCGSNCSCSSSNSDSSSSSSSSDDSSSAASNVSRKRHRKKSERMRKKSESASPNKKHSISEAAAGKTNSVGDNADDVNVSIDEPMPRAPSPPKEPLFYESDLETAESETDEEFYDEHPQKLASELLAQKRAQLMAQTRLSPSHNYDIVENSRPSTPSLPDEVAREKKVKLKKKKRERKSTSRSVAQTTGVPTLKLQFGKAPALNAENIAAVTAQQQSTLPPEVAQSSLPPHTMNEMLPAYELTRQSPNIVETAVTQEQQHNPNALNQQLTPRPIGPQYHTGRMSEGSSCSDADASLKRSKRARRPNKFYGYTSDDENMMSGLGQPLMIGMRAIKPQPPPQLTWRKEDLPTPSKSIINNKSKTPRTPKTPGAVLGAPPFGTHLNATSTLKKKRVRNTAVTPGGGDKPPRKRLTKKAAGTAKLPPIPTLKIRPSQIGLTPTNTVPNVVTGAAGGTNHIPASQIYSSSKESDDEEEEDSTDSSSDDETTQKLLLNTPVASTSNASLWSAAFQQVPAAATAPPPTAPPATASVVFQASLVLPPVLPAPPPPTPQASAFNQKIPPALLPNPDFATLQYFKANNIRYPIRPPAGARQAREGESVYCYCRCPYDEVSEMIACDGDNCLIEWFHFECVGIMVAPQGKWFCAECRPKYSEELYPAGKA